jgi:hypothetical protein
MPRLINQTLTKHGIHANPNPRVQIGIGTCQAKKVLSFEF